MTEKKFRAQTQWETREAQVDLIGRSVEYPGPDGFGTGGGFGTITAYRRTNQGDQVKVRSPYGGREQVHFLRTVRRSGLPEAIAEQG